MSKDITVDSVELDGKFYRVEASIEATWEDDSFDHDWAGGGTEVCGHWEPESVSIDAYEVTEDGEVEVTDPDLLKKLASAIERDVDRALEDYDPPERDSEPEDDGYYDDGGD